MGNACVTGSGRGSNKGSDVAPSPELPTTFKWTIDGFSSLLEKGKGWTYSNVFQMRGLNWYLQLKPRDTKSGDTNEHVSLALEMCRNSVRSDRVMKTTFKFFIYDQLFGKHHEQLVSHNFQKSSTSSGIPCMIPLADLKEKSSGFLVKDSCVFCVELISVFIAKANNVSETLFVQKKNTCSEPPVYTWNIEDFFVLKNPSYSPEFELSGHKWSIKIYPSGDDTSGNYLSLYLVMKDTHTLDENSAKLIEQTISIKSQETGKGVTKQGQSQYSKNHAGWGFDKFISLEDFEDSANGYLVKTKCCIEVQVASVGTSKTSS